MANVAAAGRYGIYTSRWFVTWQPLYLCCFELKNFPKNSKRETVKGWADNKEVVGLCVGINQKACEETVERLGDCVTKLRSGILPCLLREAVLTSRPLFIVHNFLRNVSVVSKKTPLQRQKANLSHTPYPLFLLRIWKLCLYAVSYVSVTCRATGDLAHCFDSMSYTQTEEKQPLETDV